MVKTRSITFANYNYLSSQQKRNCFSHVENGEKVQANLDLKLKTLNEEKLLYKVLSHLVESAKNISSERISPYCDN